MKLQIMKTYEFDEAKERKRILKCFKGELRTKLLNILDLFLAEEYYRMFAAYDALGYDEGSECPAAEFVGQYLMDFYDLLMVYPPESTEFRYSKLVPISVDKITNVGNTEQTEQPQKPRPKQQVASSSLAGDAI